MSSFRKKIGNLASLICILTVCAEIGYNGCYKEGQRDKANYEKIRMEEIKKMQQQEVEKSAMYARGMPFILKKGNKYIYMGSDSRRQRRWNT